MTVRPVTPADAPAVRALQEVLDHRAPRLLDAALDANTAVGEVLVVETDGDGIVGYALAVPGATNADPTTVYLAELAVAPPARRAGHATALVEAVAARYAGYDELRVVVAVDDAAARSFYDTTGFRDRALLPDRFDGDGGRLLVRSLS
ncbi:N-acetyltransferase [Halobacteriales archaeon QS_9_67_17]|nr:MAG: N-acetyltransferase [Halobacteriales archaeon QS_9_67_17]